MIAGAETVGLCISQTLAGRGQLHRSWTDACECCGCALVRGDCRMRSLYAGHRQRTSEKRKVRILVGEDVNAALKERPVDPKDGGDDERISSPRRGHIKEGVDEEVAGAKKNRALGCTAVDGARRVQDLETWSFQSRALRQLMSQWQR